MRGKQLNLQKAEKRGTSPAVQRLGLHASVAWGGGGSVLAGGTKTSYATWHSQKNKIEKKKRKSRENNGTQHKVIL